MAELREAVEGQRALQPSEQERRQRAEREARVEELLAAAPEVRDLAKRLGQVESERDRLREDLDEARSELAAARERIAELEEALEAERERSWWDRLRGR